MAKSTENLKEMGLDELKIKLSSLEEALRVLKFKTEGARSKNVKEHATLRKQVARVLTEINRKNKK
jgi:ribosomal protein L29